MVNHRVFQFELVTGSIQSMSNGLGLVSAPFLISNAANNKNGAEGRYTDLYRQSFNPQQDKPSNFQALLEIPNL